VIAFKIDENLPIEIRELLRQGGFDALTVVDQNLGGRPDTDVAAVCRSEGRCS
jgi:predicted nuclease of predicted toxin-antitoxin system